MKLSRPTWTQISVDGKRDPSTCDSLCLQRYLPNIYFTDHLLSICCNLI